MSRGLDFIAEAIPLNPILLALTGERRAVADGIAEEVRARQEPIRARYVMPRLVAVHNIAGDSPNDASAIRALRLRHGPAHRALRRLYRQEIARRSAVQAEFAALAARESLPRPLAAVLQTLLPHTDRMFALLVEAMILSPFIVHLEDELRTQERLRTLIAELPSMFGSMYDSASQARCAAESANSLASRTPFVPRPTELIAVCGVGAPHAPPRRNDPFPSLLSDPPAVRALRAPPSIASRRLRGPARPLDPRL